MDLGRFVPAPVRAHFLRRLKVGAFLLLFLLAGVLFILAVKWPFTRNETIVSLERVSLSEVQISGFHKTFFPHPGYVAERVTFKRGHAAGDRPLVSVGKISCRATWFALLTFTHRINRMDLEAVRIYIPPQIPPSVRKHAEGTVKTTVTTLVANGTVLDVAPRHDGGQIGHVEFPQLTLSNVGRNKAIAFRTVMRNPNPKGEMAVSGTVGPLMLGRIADTRLSGTYRFRHADLSGYKVIAGDLSAAGKFDGRLGRAEVDGTAAISNFEITRSRHSLGLSAEYRVTVDGTSGDVVLKSAQAHFLDTTFNVRGSITGENGKTVSLDFDGQRVQVQDLLRLFVTADRPPLYGPMTLTAHVVLPPTHRPFIKRVELRGQFSITHAEFANATTQRKVDELSARARGDKSEIKSSGPERVAEDFKGDVKLRDAIATISGALFVVPGAVATGSGTYDMITEAVDLRGKLAMHASLSKAVSGIKSVLLTPVDPLFKKNGAGAVLRVRIGGTYSHPVFRVSPTP